MALSSISKQGEDNTESLQRIQAVRGAAISGHWIYGCIGSTALTGANQACEGMRGKRYQPKHIFHVRLPAIFHGSFPAKSIYHRERDRADAVGFRTPVSLIPFPLYWPAFQPSLVGSFELPEPRRVILNIVSFWLKKVPDFLRGNANATGSIFNVALHAVFRWLW